LEDVGLVDRFAACGQVVGADDLDDVDVAAGVRLFGLASGA